MAITFKSVLASGGSGATITVTYSSEFYNQTFTATNGTDTVTALATSTGTVDISVPSAGSWVVSCTISGETYTSETVSVDLSYSTELVAIPDGSTVTPTDDVQTWLKCAGINDKAYTTLSEVLADSVTFNALLGDSNACAYMARSTTWAETLCADQYAMSMIGQYDVCCDALLGNATWASAIFNSTYASYIIHATVPTMTSNTTPYGEAGANAYWHSDSRFVPWHAFDGSHSSEGWLPNAWGDYVYYHFTSAVIIKRISAYFSDPSSRSIRNTIQVIASHDCSTWENIGSSYTMSGVNITDFVSLYSNNTAYEYYGVKATGSASGHETGNGNGWDFQFFGHVDGTEKIHGTTNESAYYLDNGTEVAIVDPSTLSAGTYTFGSTVAKDPSDLTADYRKQIRITPNTVEVVLRPDCALYWWGYEGANLEDLTTANGWSIPGSGITLSAPTHNSYDINITSSSGVKKGVGTKYKVTGTKAYCVATGTLLSGRYGDLTIQASKALSYSVSTMTNITSSSMTKYSIDFSENYLTVDNDGARGLALSAMWYE